MSELISVFSIKSYNLFRTILESLVAFGLQLSVSESFWNLNYLIVGWFSVNFEKS